nr:MAG TPA: hypothetical protein [Caudoviricetes sp.]
MQYGYNQIHFIRKLINYGSHMLKECSYHT